MRDGSFDDHGMVGLNWVHDRGRTARSEHKKPTVMSRSLPRRRTGLRRKRPTLALVSTRANPFAAPGERTAGGMNVVVSQLAYGFASRGVSVDVFTHHGGTRVVSRPLGRHLRVIAVPRGRGSSTAWLSRRRLGLPPRYDVIHAHYWQSAPLAMALGADGPSRLVQTFHTLHSKPLGPRLGCVASATTERARGEHEAAGLADCVIVGTVQEELAVGELRPCSNTFLAPPGLPINMLKRSAMYRRPRGGHVIRLVAVGRIDPVKGFDLALRTVARLRDDQIRAHVTIVGGPSGPHGPDELAYLQKLVDALSLQERVTFTGSRPYGSTLALVDKADIALVCSHGESFGLAALEAQQLGTPVVSTRVGVVSRLAENGGAVIRERNCEDFAGGVEALLRTSPREVLLGTAASAALYSLRRSISLHHEAYELAWK